MTLPKHRISGAPSAALPAIIGFVFLSVIAPIFYANAFAIAYMNGKGAATDTQFNDYINYGLGGSVVWTVATVFLVLYPATRGKLWALRCLRLMAIGGILALIAAVIADIVGYFRWPALQGGFALFLFWCFLAPLMVAAGFLVDGLLHQPWFDPNAAAAEIGPSRGTVGDLNLQAGLDAKGRLPPEKLADALAAPPPPPRWLCYVAPPIAALQMRKWCHAAIFTPICLAALAFVLFLPFRAIFIYGLMGTFADRLRAIATYRKTVAQGQSLAPDSLRRTVRKRSA